MQTAEGVSVDDRPVVGAALKRLSEMEDRNHPGGNGAPAS